MKPLKLLLIAMAAVLIAFGLGGYALAFHGGGVAHCDGCHTMHNSEGGQSIIDGGVVGQAGEHLLLGVDISSTCLGCHEGAGSYHVFSSDGSNFSPGGDFYWMTKEFTYTSHGTHVIKKSNHGHNIIAADPSFNLIPDEDITQAPGGGAQAYQASWLSCASCHNPHGGSDRPGVVVGSGSYGADPAALGPNEIYGNYRLLGDSSYDGGMGDLYSFSYDSPVAVAPSNSNLVANDGEKDDVHTDYGSGMSEWCANCHEQFLTAGASGHVHPVGNDQHLLDHAANYNAYVKTGDLSGMADSSYLQFVRFERGILRANITDLHATGPMADDGPSSTSNVMCLTCHRAHASAFPNSGAWFFESELIAGSHPAAGDTGVTGNDVLNSYYGRNMAADFGPEQRSFCNKCHVKD